MSEEDLEISPEAREYANKRMHEAMNLNSKEAYNSYIGSWRTDFPNSFVNLPPNVEGKLLNLARELKRRVQSRYNIYQIAAAQYLQLRTGELDVRLLDFY